MQKQTKEFNEQSKAYLEKHSAINDWGDNGDTPLDAFKRIKDRNYQDLQDAKITWDDYVDNVSDAGETLYDDMKSYSDSWLEHQQKYHSMSIDDYIAGIDREAERLEELSARLQQGAYTLLEQEQRRLVTMQARIPALVHRKLSEARFTLLTARKDLSQVTQNLLSRQRHRLELLQQRVADNSPEKLLSRGYSITLKDGKAVTDASLLQPGDQLTTRLLKGEVQSTVR